MNPTVFSGTDNPMVRLDALKAELRAAGKPIFDFGIGDPLEPMPAFLLDALRNAIPAVGQYPRVAGTATLRSAVAGYLRRRFGVVVDPDRQILPAAGAKEAIFHLPLCVIDPRAERRAVIYPNPGYPIYERGCAFAGGEAHPIVLDEAKGYLLEPSDLPEELLRRTALFWLSYPHNPTGAVAPRDYLERVAEASRRFGFTVAADECYADVYDGEPPLSYLQITCERALVIHSLSKRSGMTGMRSGFMAGDPEIVGALKRFRPAIGTASQDFVQAAAAAAWSDDDHARQRRELFAQKRRLFLSFLSELGFRIAGSQAGLYLWFELPEHRASEPWALDLAQRTGVILQPGAFLGEGGEGHARLALSPLFGGLPQGDLRLEECSMMDFGDIRARIEAAWTDRALVTNDETAAAIRETIAALDRGELRAAEKRNGGWQTNAWVKEAILLYFSIARMERIEIGPFEFHDKIPLKRGLDSAGVRVVPPGTARYGSFLARGAILMPGYVNIGAHVGSGTLVDTWATVGSCAQIGEGVHLSGGVGIGGVLEPPTASPVIVEDHCFIGSRCVLVEGVVIEEGAVLGANVVITASTPILDVTGPTEKLIKGRVPARSVVIPGSRPKQFPAGNYELPCALIIGQRSASTDRKTSLNEVLRQFAVQG